MKKKLLVVSMIVTSIANAQFTQTNEPAIGATTNMYVCDSNYTDAAAATGTGVTWDFSDITGYPGDQLKVLSVASAAGLGFTGSTKVTEIPSFISHYWSSTATERVSQGFVFNEVSVGDVTVKLSGDEEKLMNYTFAFASTFDDTYAGTLHNAIFADPEVACTGTITSTVDGSGTLILPDATTTTNVLRHKIVETTIATVVIIPGLPGTDVTVTRTQYDYVAAIGGLPLFSHSKVVIVAAALNIEVNVVLSSVDPVTASVTKNDMSNFNVFPNPTQGNITLTGEFDSNASAQVLDQTGRVVASLDALNNGSTIDLTGVNKGIYFVAITNNGVKSTKTISVN
jgi:hypothetical protein